MFKDECNARIIAEFVGLRSKMYCIRVEGEGEMKMAKGVKKSVIENDIKFSNYLNCLVNEQVLEHNFKCICSQNHEVNTLHMHKKTLCGFDDKRFLINMIHSVPYGYKNMKTC